MITYFAKRLCVCSIIICTSILFSSCGGDEQATDESQSTADSVTITYAPPSEEPADYGEWITYQHETFKIIYPEKHPHANVIPDMARACMGALRSDCRFLGLELPTDTLTLYYYVGPGHGRSSTGEMYPYYVGDTLHYWTPSALGTPLMKYLINKWQPAEPEHRFLWHGLIALLDNSGTNYHERTLSFVDSGLFVPLNQLAVDPTINSDNERYTSAMAASLVDFLVYYYGLDKFGQLYVSQEEFGQSVQTVYGVSTDSLQTLWLNVTKRAITQLKNQNQNQ